MGNDPQSMTRTPPRVSRVFRGCGSHVAGSESKVLWGNFDDQYDNQYMDIAYISALAALGGSVVGGMTSGLTTWISQRAQARAGQLAHEMSRRDDLYKDFIVAASKAYGDALLSSEPQIQELLVLYAMISRMRLMSLPRTLACAEKVMESTLATYYSPNITIRELHELTKSGVGIIDPLKDFSEAARDELLAFNSL
jgi:hypothetical protein